MAKYVVTVGLAFDKEVTKKQVKQLLKDLLNVGTDTASVAGLKKFTVRQVDQD